MAKALTMPLYSIIYYQKFRFMIYKIYYKGIRRIVKIFFTLPVPMPIEKYNVIIFRAHILASKHELANSEPIIVTTRHPNLFTNRLDIGPSISFLLYLREIVFIENNIFTRA